MYVCGVSDPDPGQLGNSRERGYKTRLEKVLQHGSHSLSNGLYAAPKPTAALKYDERYLAIELESKQV